MNILRPKKTFLILSTAFFITLVTQATVVQAAFLIEDDFSASTVTTDPIGFNRARTRTAVDIGDAGGWIRGVSGAWTLAGGALVNSSDANTVVGESAVAVVVDVSSITNTSITALDLSFDYTLGDATESLYLHTWGIVNNGAGGLNETSGMDLSAPFTGANDHIMHLNQTNGSAIEITWQFTAPGDPSKDVLDVYNLLDGETSVGSTGTATLLTGTTVTQTYDTTFDLSAFTTGPDNLAGYDYILIGFARNVAGASSSVTIDNFNLSMVPEPSTFALAALGLLSLGMFGRRRRRR